MDRFDAIRLLRALVAAGMDTHAARENAWIETKAFEIGLEGNARWLSVFDLDQGVANWDSAFTWA